MNFIIIQITSKYKNIKHSNLESLIFIYIVYFSDIVFFRFLIQTFLLCETGSLSNE